MPLGSYSVVSNWNGWTFEQMAQEGQTWTYEVPPVADRGLASIARTRTCARSLTWNDVLLLCHIYVCICKHTLICDVAWDWVAWRQSQVACWIKVPEHPIQHLVGLL